MSGTSNYCCSYYYYNKPEGIRLQIFRFFGDGFGVKEKKKAEIDR